MSITGEFGKDIKKFTKTLLTKNLVHIIASDAHSKDRRPPILSRAVAEAATLIGKDQAEMMVKKIPQAVITGRKIEIENL
jgi:protein-tyrosine phosphatase